jgi:pimeloyl-ACP methyl ester carboxylesterase
MPITTINNISIYYEQHGEGSDDLILIGGLSSDHQVWKSTLRHFSKQFRILIFDNRGAGRSSTPDYPYTTDMMANDVLQLMDLLEIKRAHVLGHSMGGCIAQQIALLAPERINKMIVACSRAKPNVLANMALTMREKLQAAGMPIEILAEYVMPLLFSETFLQNSCQVKGFIQWTMQNPHPQSALGFSHQLHAVKTHDVSNRLAEIHAPTLVIAGDEDILMPKASAKVFAENIKNSEFVVIPDCAHMPHVEKSREFAEHVMRFLSVA